MSFYTWYMWQSSLVCALHMLDWRMLVVYYILLLYLTYTLHMHSVLKYWRCRFFSFKDTICICQDYNYKQKLTYLRFVWWSDYVVCIWFYEIKSWFYCIKNEWSDCSIYSGWGPIYRKIITQMKVASPSFHSCLRQLLRRNVLSCVVGSVACIGL